MFTRAELKDGTILIHTEVTSLKSTYSFLAGGISINTSTQSITLGRADPIALPANLLLHEGDTLLFQLVAPTGELKKQVRTVTLGKCVDGIFKIAGRATTPAKFTATDGWSIKVYKMRAYLSHTGVKTDGVIPQWIKDSVARQRKYWNSLAWLCRDARRKCTSDAEGDARVFIDENIFPAIDAFNDSLGRSKNKIRYPQSLKKEDAQIQDLFSFKMKLLHAKEKGSMVPDGLAEKIEEFCSQYQVQYSPVKEFLRNLPAIMEREATKFGLKHWEIESVNSRFQAVLKTRAKAKPKPAFSSGWPRLKYEDSNPGWEIHNRLGKSGIQATGVYQPNGVGSLFLGNAVDPSQSGHGNMNTNSRKGNRCLRPVTIRIPDGRKSAPFVFNFCVIEHRPLPRNAHIKGWNLVYKDGEHSLCLTLEVRNPVPQNDGGCVGVDIGWRRTDHGLRVAMAYDMEAQQFSELLLDFERSPIILGDRLRVAEREKQLKIVAHRPESVVSIVETSVRKKGKPKLQYIIALGASRKYRHSKTLPTKDRGELTTGAIQNLSAMFSAGEVTMETAIASTFSFLDQSREYRFEDTFQGAILAAQRRSVLENLVKQLIGSMLGSSAPVWFPRAGRKGLQKLASELPSAHPGKELLNVWMGLDAYFGNGYSEMMRRLTGRLHKGYELFADRMVASFEGESKVLAIEQKFLKGISAQVTDEDAGLKAARKYRQWAALSVLIGCLKRAAQKYGSTVTEVSASGTTAVHAVCGAKNQAGSDVLVKCMQCSALYDQDENAAVNIAIAAFSADPGEASAA
ncbi:MAG: zinc ribbon domain-containing protein [Acidobacteriaceae bacterium]